MSKFKTMIVASALVIDVGTWAAASIIAEAGLRERGFTASSQIDVLNWMSNAKDLPVQTADAI